MVAVCFRLLLLGTKSVQDRVCWFWYQLRDQLHGSLRTPWEALFTHGPLWTISWLCPGWILFGHHGDSLNCGVERYCVFTNVFFWWTIVWIGNDYMIRFHQSHLEKEKNTTTIIQLPFCLVLSWWIEENVLGPRLFHIINCINLRWMGYYGGWSLKPQLGLSNANLGWLHTNNLQNFNLRYTQKWPLFDSGQVARFVLIFVQVNVCCSTENNVYHIYIYVISTLTYGGK